LGTDVESPDSDGRIATLQKRNRGPSLNTRIVPVKTKRTIEVTIERNEFSILGKGRESAYGWCGVCARSVRMVTPEEAARRSGVSVRTIYRNVEMGDLHFRETPQGLLLICVTSLA